MHRLSVLLTLLFATTFLPSCRVFDPPEDVPAYITFRNPRVQLDTTTGFTSDIGIRNVWLYQGGFLQGTYSTAQLEDGRWPTIPLIDLEKTDFFMEAGVFESGQSVFQIPYRFWDRIYFDLVAQAGDTVVLEPVFPYVDPVQYVTPVEENFEGFSVDLVPFATALTEPDSTFVRVVSNGAFQGNRAGFVPFGSDDRWFEVINTSPFSLSREKDTYAEITYRCSVPFEVGLVYSSLAGVGFVSVITVTPKEEWNTIYVHLIQQIRDIINAGGEQTDFWLWMKADGQGNDGYIYLDDIRLIHER